MKGIGRHRSLRIGLIVGVRRVRNRWATSGVRLPKWHGIAVAGAVMPIQIPRTSMSTPILELQRLQAASGGGLIDDARLDLLAADATPVLDDLSIWHEP